MMKQQYRITDPQTNTAVHPQTSLSRWLMLIIVAAVLLRVGAAIYLGNQVTVLPGTFDQVSYDMLAHQLLAGQGFTVADDWWPATPAGEPTAHWSYLYTLYLVAFYSLFGYYPLLARLLQAVVAGILLPWLTYRLGKRHFGEQVGLVAAALSAGYFYFVYYAAALMTETFYIIAILWVLDLTGRLGEADHQPSAVVSRQAILLGVALALTVLLRQVFLLFAPILFAWLLWRSYRYGRSPGPPGGSKDRSVPAAGGPGGLPPGPLLRMLGRILLATMILIAAIVPWTLRNYRAFDTFVLLNTNAGFAFFWGNHPIHGYNFIDILPDDYPSYQALIPAELKNLNEGQLDRALLKRGLAFIQADPLRYAILSISRVKDYFKFWPSPTSSLISNISRVFSFGLFLPFILYGLWLGRRQWPMASLLYLFIIVYTGIHLLSWALIRYRLPVDASLLIFAGVALVEIKDRLVQRQARISPAMRANTRLLK